MKKSDFIIVREERAIKKKLQQISDKLGFGSGFSKFMRLVFRKAIKDYEEKKLVLGDGEES